MKKCIKIKRGGETKKLCKRSGPTKSKMPKTGRGKRLA